MFLPICAFRAYLVNLCTNATVRVGGSQFNADHLSKALEACKFRPLGRKHRACQCPIWAAGILRGKKFKKSLDLRSWEAAQKAVLKLESEGERETVSLKTAAERFITARRTKGNTEETLRKLKRLTRNMTGFFGDIPLESVSVDDVARFYESWKLGPLTREKQLERMRSFFNFCLRRKWITDNPCLGIERPAIHEIERKPYEPEELEKIEWAIQLFDPRGIYGVENRTRLKAFITVLRWTGLRIRDVVQLKRSQVQEDHIVLRTQKNKKQVKLVMHSDVKEALALTPGNGEYFFWSGEGNSKSCVGNWQRSFRRLSKVSGVHVHAHRWRHTFATELLSRGVSIADVAVILGNSPRIVEKHYAQFVKQRQDFLDKAVQATFV